MFRAEEWGFRERDTNPCLGIAKNPRKKVARILDEYELARLGRALDAHEARWPEAVWSTTIATRRTASRPNRSEAACSSLKKDAAAWTA